MCQVCQRDRDDGWIKCSSNCNTWFHLDCASKGTTRLHSESEWHCPHCTVANKRRTDNSQHNCAMCDESVTMKEGHACEGILCGRWYCNKCYRSLKDDEKVRDPYWYCPECHTTIKIERQFNCVYCGSRDLVGVKGPMIYCCVDDCETASHIECTRFPPIPQFSSDENFSRDWKCPRCADGKRLCSACQRNVKKASTDKCDGVCGKWFCKECGDVGKMLERKEDYSKSQKVNDNMANGKCAECRHLNELPDEDDKECLICGADKSKGKMAFCNGECSNICHVKCMGYSSANFGHHKYWYCFQCQDKAAENPYFEVLEEGSKMLTDVDRAARRRARDQSEWAAKIHHINMSHTLDERDELTPGTVKKLASGEWDGHPFVVQIVQIQIGCADESIVGRPAGSDSKVENHTKIGITDGKFITTVGLGMAMVPMLKIYGGEVEEFSLIFIDKCDYELRPDTKILNKVPGKP